MLVRLLICAAAVCHARAAVLRVGVVLGVNNDTATALGSTSDEEQWVYKQAAAEIGAELAASGSSYTSALSSVFAGESDDPALVSAFLRKCAADGARIVVGPRSTPTLMAVLPLARSLGLVLVSPDSGVPPALLPAPRSNLFRLWPADTRQADALGQLLAQRTLARAVVLSRNDDSGVALAQAFAAHAFPGPPARGTLLAPVGYYNASLGPGVPSSIAAALRPLKAAVVAALAAKGAPPVALLCNCASEEVADILAELKQQGWPDSGAAGAAADGRFQLVLTDRSTPTRTVVDSAHLPIALALNVTGVLSRLARDGNPAYDSLMKRWHADGHTTPLFASAASTFDAIKVAARTLMQVGGKVNAADGATLAQLESAFAATAQQFYGVSGSMAVDAAGDLVRADYDVYQVQSDGWHVVDRINA